MIIHEYPDKSQGYEYEIGDRVRVKKTIQGGWFDAGVTTAETCIVEKITPFLKDKHWLTQTYLVRWSKNWGPAECSKHGLEPHPETIAAATVVKEQ